ncbi:MAG: hypothetical protein MEQ07_04940 [Aquimonas sp.]|nr:hypothetical protein [Aquimonas sp.]
MEDRRQLGVLIETRYSNGSAPLKQYLFTDALGSVGVIASATGAVLQRMSFDPHGGRRNGNDWNSAAAFVIPPYTTRGFTGHEQLDSVGLVHMGGRVNDPELGVLPALPCRKPLARVTWWGACRSFRITPEPVRLAVSPAGRAGR